MPSASHSLSRHLVTVAIASATLASPLPALACSSEPLLASMCIFAGNFAPRGWAFTDGQILSISQNTALFSLLGTTFGGNGQTNFALPDTRGRTLIGARQGPGLSNYALGETGGAESVTLNANQMPAHNHTAQTNVTVSANGQSGNGAADGPGGNVWAAKARGGQYSSTAPDVAMAAGAVSASAATTVGSAGGSQPHENRPPFLAINYMIATEGIFPSRP